MSRRYTAERIRERIRTVWLDEAYRLIGRKYHDQPLQTGTRGSRFSDPLRRYRVLYAAENIACAVWEGLARSRFTRRRQRVLKLDEVERWTVAALCTIEPLALADLRGDGPVRIGAPAAVTHDADHRAGQALSDATYRNVPEADGFVYLSRFTGHTCVAVFDRATAKVGVRDVRGLVDHPKFAEVLSDYEIVLDDSAK